MRTVLSVWSLDLPGLTRFEFRFGLLPCKKQVRISMLACFCLQKSQLYIAILPQVRFYETLEKCARYDILRLDRAVICTSPLLLQEDI